MNTLMVKESTFTLSDEKMQEWTSKARNFLSRYDYDTDDYALKKVFTEWAEKKGWLVDLFRKSPNYNGNGQIIMTADLSRPVDMDKIREFYDWACVEFSKTLEKYEIRIGMFSANEYEKMMGSIRSRVLNMDKGYLYGGMTQGEWEMELERMRRRWSEVVGYDPYREIRIGDKIICVRYDIYNRIAFFRNILWRALDLGRERDEINVIDEGSAEYINDRCESLKVKTRAIVGQRVNKFMGKFLKELGMNHIVDRKTISWTDTNTGEVHTREKDYGYNYYYAMLGDAINPLKYTRDVVISVNPFDYWTMSFGFKWASCHTIDKSNYRHVGHSNYQGCYSGGTESYMLDPSSVIVYVRPTDDELESIGESEMEMELQSKFKRAVFMLGEDKLVESRVYPDGRDGGDEGIAAELRNIMQKVIADLYETPNMWTLKKGTRECCNVISTASGHTHYKDYESYDDCNVSYLRRINGDLNYNRIVVGAKIICPSCGMKHSSEQHITCNSCFGDGNICDNCGASVSEDEEIYADGRYFCCASCACESGFEYCDDVEEWRRQCDCTYEEYSERWFYRDSDGVWTADGQWFHNEDTAREAGYEYSVVDGEWYCEDDIAYLANGDSFHMPHHEEAVETPDGWYLTEEDAVDNGWIRDENGEFVAA